MVDEKTVNALINSANEAHELWIPDNVPEVTDIQPFDFYKQFVSKNIPCVIKNGCKHWPAISKWTNEYLISNIRNDITVAITPNGRADDVINNEFMLPLNYTSTLEDYFTKLKPNPDFVAYIQNQNSSLSQEFASIQSDVSLPQLATVFSKMDACNLWIGDERSVTALHKDPYENLYAVVRGTKVFTLVAPIDAHCLYRQMYNVTQYKNFEFEKEDLGYKVPGIPFDLDNVDFNLFPLAKIAKVLKVEVEEGDLLYLPSLWFHKVEQIGRDGVCVAVNYWFDMEFDARYTWGLFMDKLFLEVDESDDDFE